MSTAVSYPFYKSLRFRFGLFFGFLFFAVLMALVFVMYKKIRQELEENFSGRLKSGAELVLQKTSVNPLIIPLPHNSESFTLLYNNGSKIDTLYTNLNNTSSGRKIQTAKTLETGGSLHLVYSLPDEELVRSLASWQRLLFVYLPLAFLLSLLLGYTLSGVLLHPIRQIISKAATTNLQTDIQLLPGLKTDDELQQLTEAVNRMLERIKHQVAEQNAFFASASHELRTPLSNMLTELQVIDLTGLSEETVAMLESQKSEVQRMIDLVNQFLLMSQLKADALPSRKTVINLLDLCVNTIEKFQVKARDGGQHFRLSVTPQEEVFLLRADWQQIEIIVANLIANAIKYGSKNKPIEVQLIKTEAAVQLIITNETDRIIENPDQLGQQFYREGFYKEGFGLGLWIIRQMLKKTGGNIHIRYDHRMFSVQIDFHNEQ